MTAQALQFCHEKVSIHAHAAHTDKENRCPRNSYANDPSMQIAQF